MNDIIKNISRYRYWDILEDLPDGWCIDKTAGSPSPNTVFITNGKNLLSGQQKRALLRIKSKSEINILKKEIVKIEHKEEVKIAESFIFPAKTVNTLARKKFQEQLLKEIMFDLMVCEIEGWDKKVYVREIKKLLNSIDTSSKTKEIKQLDLFCIK